ncbi:MAG: gliding motility-associated C-terminal domain-containing protein [Chitinophagales bacterium]|nr:gliding motility-associated C-terminal domain-containing protein [Chitinophagales bacterium]
MQLFFRLTLSFYLTAVAVFPIYAQQRPFTKTELDSVEAVFRLSPAGLQTPRPSFLQNRTPGSSHPAARQVRSQLPESQQAICQVNTGRSFLRSDSVYYYSYNPALTADGNLLISGSYYLSSPPFTSGGFLLKCDLSGNIIWNKLYDSANHTGFNYFNYYKVIELADGSILMAGSTNDEPTQNDDLVITKTDNTGNVIWSKTFKSRMWTFGNGSADYFYVQDMKEDPFTGDLYFCGPHWSSGKALIKINSTNGSITWSNLYQYSNNGFAVFDLPFGIEIRSDEIRYFGRFSANATRLSVIRINKQTGDTISSKTFKTTDTAGYKVELLSAEDFTIKSNGNYLLGGKCYGYWLWQWNGITPLYQASVVEIDSNLNFVTATVFRSAVETNLYNTKVTVFPDGSGLLSYLVPRGGFSGDIYYTQFRNGQILKRRMRTFTNEGNPFENNAVRLPDGTDLVTKILGDSINGQNRNDFLKLHPADTASVCLGLDESLTIAEPVNYDTDAWWLDSVGYQVFYESNNKTITVSTHTPNRIPACFQQSHCDTVKLLSSATTTCPGQPLTITIRKNRECGSLVPLQFDTSAVSSVVQLNDSTVVFQFDAAWSGYIYGSVQGCTLHKDSVWINVLQAPASLNLGPDTVICPGNTLYLNAHAGYASYQWQNGSISAIDSVFTVTQPGIYYVTTTNACGGTFSDTVYVAAHPPIPLSIGPDRTKCNNDTIQVEATPGFINYTWSPDYNLNTNSGPRIIANPLADTMYTLIAEKTPGCFAFDTVRIRVFSSPAITLGPDRSFCRGDSLLLNAGTGFVTYNWNTGSNTSQLVVHNPGIYHVWATTADGCNAADTIQVPTLFSLPVVALDHNPSLCTGDNRILDAGSGFSSYLWNNGHTGPAIIVDTVGIYGVTVIDNNGCRGTDTTVISQLLPLPSGILPPDTAICDYGTIELKSIGQYNRYTWSTGTTGPVITITQPGLYTLQVTDNNNCTAKDSIIVNPKECLKGFYIPTAFTPNKDGKNDVFKPMLFGNIKQYSFRIFNRWGQVVFETKDINRGWEGEHRSSQQDSNVFVWICSYQLEGESIQTEKGTVVLIK